MAISITDLGHRRRIREILRLCGNPVGGGIWSRWIALFLLLLNLNRCISGQSIIAPGGRTLFNGASLIRSFVERDHFLLETPDGKSVSITRYVTPLALVYGFHPKWTMIFVQPYLVNRSTFREGEQIRHANSNGLADSQLFVHYDGLYSRNSPGGLTRLSAVFGLQVPTGAERFSTRAVEYSTGLVFEKAVRLKYVFTADFEYTFATSNRQHTSMGDRARFDAAPAYFLIAREPLPADAPWLRKAFHRLFRNGAYAIVEFNGTWQGHARVRGNELFDSGGTTLSISPGIQYFVGPKFLVEFSAPIPTVKRLNGFQPEPQSTFLGGFRYLF